MGRTFDVKSELFQLGAQDGFGGVLSWIQGEDEWKVGAPSEREGAKVFHGAEGLVKTPRLDLSGGARLIFTQRYRQPLAPRKVELVEEGP